MRNNKLSTNLNYLRKEKNLSYTDLAQLLGVSKSLIHRIEKGDTRNPGILSIIKLSKTLGVSKIYLQMMI